ATVFHYLFLFSDTLSTSTAFYTPAIPVEEVRVAANKVGAYDFIMRLPGGFDYQVQQRGATLSEGQAQLISFIRALVHDPAISILDEATSSIDTESELLIQSAFEKLMIGRTA